MKKKIQEVGVRHFAIYFDIFYKLFFIYVYGYYIFNKILIC